MTPACGLAGRPARRFAFRLALALGQVNPDAMLARLPQRVWSE